MIHYHGISLFISVNLNIDDLLASSLSPHGVFVIIIRVLFMTNYIRYKYIFSICSKSRFILAENVIVVKLDIPF